MKYIYAIVFFTNLFFQTEKYYVTFVKGRATSSSTGKVLKAGDIIQPSEKLIFDKAISKVVCISPGKGRFEISPGQKKSIASEFWAVVKSNIIPVLNNYHFSTRAIGFEGYDPATYFQSSETAGKILLISDQVLPVKASYKRDSTNFFFLQYSVHRKRITQKIDQNDLGIWFNLQTFSAVSTGDLPSKVTLCYQSIESGIARSTTIADFVPVLLTKGELKQQVQIIKTYLGTTDPKKIRIETEAHLYDNFGKIGDTEFTSLLQ